MKGIVLERFGGPEVLEVKDWPEPACPPDGYVIGLKAIGVNFADTVERRGLYRRNQALPYPLGKEASGVVMERGPLAHEFQPGDAVIVVKFDNGCYAQRVSARPDQVLRPPQGLSFHEMAAFGTSYGTAWFAMHELARVRPGESALIQAAAGGVGTAAVSLAASFGCAPVVGTAGGPQKCAFVESLGADACIDYSTRDFKEIVRDLTGGRGIDYCLESVGGQVYEDSLAVLAPLGRLVIIGFSSIRDNYAERIARLHPLTLFQRSISVAGLNADNIQFQANRAVWERLVAHAEEHRIRPRVGAVYPLERAGAAHTAIESRQTMGKVILEP
ncbi:MAG: NADPH:quinone oxidoreductase family protein [Planctomycetota bacterium]|nr:MAG: NADPH:quinone oxidoreductase family protein [Planctomycetota bacterium]